MQRTLYFLLLTGLLVAGWWPSVGIAQSAAERGKLIMRFQEGSTQSYKEAVQEEPDIAPASLIIQPPGFGIAGVASGLASPRGFVQDPDLQNFPCCFVLLVVERSLNRVASVNAFGGTPTAFATGLSQPTDLVDPGQGGTGPFGNFLYVTETGSNRISRIDKTGAITPFVSFTSAPKRLAFSPALGAFGTPTAPFLFVTLADGRIVKVAPSGAVTSCASGLSGPEGLVFGPGGSAFKNVLFVAEATANRVSKVNPDCTVSPFASTGLSAPLTLATSPGGAWGPIDTLYVVHATTQIARIDKSGNVTPFASGLSQADTVRLPSLSTPFFDRLGLFLPWSPGSACIICFPFVSDGGAGTATVVGVNLPSVSLQLTGCNPCRAGDPFAVTLTVKNTSPIDLPEEVKADFRLLDGTPVNFSPLNDEHFTTILPQGFTFSGPWLSFSLPPVSPGVYCYDVSLIDPVSGDHHSSPFLGAGSRVCFSVLP